jgi:hypothetical protein
MRQTKKLLIVFAVAGVMLVACGGGDGGSGDDYAARLRGDTQSLTGAQTQMQAPAPQQVEVTRVVPVEVVKEVPVEIVREVVKQVFVEVTPEAPAIQNFSMSTAGDCNTYESLPYRVEDDGTIYGEYPICAWETAVALSNEAQP